MPALNKLCSFGDFADPELQQIIRELTPDAVQSLPGYPTGYEHRKLWEFGHLIRGLRGLGAIRDDAVVLSVAGGHEEPAYYLTNHVARVHLTDLYGESEFSGHEAAADVLTNPDKYARFPYRRDRLVVQNMNALSLEFAAGTFDAVFSLSSIEHFGGVDGARKGLLEMSRVVKPGGVVAVFTECVVNQAPDMFTPGLSFFRPRKLAQLAASLKPLELVEPIDFSLDDVTRRSSMTMAQALEDIRTGTMRHPHIVLEMEGRQFTSVAMFFRKRPERPGFWKRLFKRT